MEKERVLDILRTHAGELQQKGVLHLHLFGSVARGDNTANSDVDVFAEFEPNMRVTLVTLGSVEVRLSELLGRQVELSVIAWMKQRVRERAAREAVLAF